MEHIGKRVHWFRMDAGKRREYAGVIVNYRPAYYGVSAVYIVLGDSGKEHRVFVSHARFGN